MKVLGIDPGLRHVGWALLDEGRVTSHGVIIYPDRGKQPIEEYLRFILPKIDAVIEETKPQVAAVEQVSWFGKARRITLPLSHVAGALLGLLWCRGVDSFMLTPGMKKGVKLRKPAKWSEHEYDAALLAKKVQAYLSAVSADESSVPKELKAVHRRRITATAIAHGRLCRRVRR